MPGSLGVDIVISLLSACCLGLAFTIHWSFALVPFFTLGLIVLPALKERIILVGFIVSFCIGFPIFGIGTAYFYISDIPFVLLLLIALNGRYFSNVDFVPLRLPFLIMLAAFVLSFLVNIINYPLIYMISGLIFVLFFCKLIIIYHLGIIFGRKYGEDISIYALYFSSFLAVCAAIYQIYIKQDPLLLIIGATGTLGGHHSALGTFLVLPIAIAITRLLTKRTNITFDLFILLFSIIGVFLAQSRSSIFSLFICIPILSIKYFFGNNKRWIILVGIFTVLIISAYVLGPTIYEKTFKARGGIDLSSYSRLIIWEGAITSFDNYPIYKKIFGSGVSAYKINNRLPFMLDGSISINGGHNQYIHALIETGVFGLLSFLFLWGSVFVYLYKRLKEQPNLLAAWLTLTALLLSGIVQENFWFNAWHGYTFFAFIYFLGLYIGQAKK